MNFTPHIEWLDCSCGLRVHGIVRLFRNPVAPLVGEMPGQAWEWCCNFELRGKSAIIKAAMTAPPAGSVRVMTTLARELGCEVVIWERLEGAGVRWVRFTV